MSDHSIRATTTNDDGTTSKTEVIHDGATGATVQMGDELSQDAQDFMDLLTDAHHTLFGDD